MKNHNRIIDANINRISEGIRVLEDLSRFYFNEYSLTNELKQLRHLVRKSILEIEVSKKLIDFRDSQNDIGLNISQESRLDDKNDIQEIISGNSKRIQEGLRVVEENLKIIGFFELSKKYESFRYLFYDMEKRFHKILQRSKRKNINNKDIYCILCEELSNGKSNIEVVKILIDSGIEIIQYREKEKSMLEKYNQCLEIRKLTKESGAIFIVNDHVDLAKAVNADGVHIGQDDLPIEVVREFVGDEMIIGLSTHSIAQAKEAVKRGADYIGVGPIFKTDTKKDVCAPVGFEYLDFVVNNIDLPFVAIGGIKQGNILDIINHGAKTVAMVSEIVCAKDISKKIKNIRKLISNKSTHL